MSDTPRTDAAKLQITAEQNGSVYAYTAPNQPYWGDVCRADQMQALEQELNTANAAITELNARLEERAQDHIKASARDVAEIQRLRVELDAIKRRAVKPLVWIETHISPNNRRIQAQGTACMYRVHSRDGNIMMRVSTKRQSAIYAEKSINEAKRIAEDLHREAVLALLETEA